MNYLMKIRKREHLKQKEFSDMLGISYSYYVKVERGVRPASGNFLKKFRSVFPYDSLDPFFREEVKEYGS